MRLTLRRVSLLGLFVALVACAAGCRDNPVNRPVVAEGKGKVVPPADPQPQPQPPAPAPEADPIAADVAAARRALHRTGTVDEFVKENAAARRNAWKEAAQKGAPGAQWLYGKCVGLGAGIKAKQSDAVRWYRASAEQGFALAQNTLGECYRDGEGVTENAAEAVNWFRKAAAQNEPAGQFNLGDMYEDGEGVEEDMPEAVRWYRKASEGGYGEATVRLVVAFEEGDGVEKNAAEAAKLRALAREQMGPTAEQKIARYAFHHNPVGRPAPEATARVNGASVKLSECRGKVAVVAFLAERGSVDERAQLRALADRLKDAPFVLLTIDPDRQPEQAEAWGAETPPAVFVIDQKGIVRATDLHGKELGTEVDKLLKEPPER